MQISIGLQVNVPCTDPDGNAVLGAWCAYATAVLAASGFKTTEEIEYVDHWDNHAIGRMWLQSDSAASYKKASAALLFLSDTLLVSVSGTATQAQTDHVHNVVAAQVDAQIASDVYLDGNDITGNFVLNNAAQLAAVLEAVAACDVNK